MRGRGLVVALMLPFAAVAQDAAPRPDPKPESAEAEAPPPKAKDIEPPVPAAPTPKLAYPKRATKPAADPAPSAPAEPEAPPLHSSLRETDFDHAACLMEIWWNGAQYEVLPAITDETNRDCGIDRPIRVSQILPGVVLDGDPVMRCDTARSLMYWLHDAVQPATRFLPGQPSLAGIEPGSTYQCRATVGNESSKLSEHALGNAFDIAAFRFADDSRFVIEPREDSGGMEIAFQAAIRASACLYFTTVLGPGSNAAHDDHLHLDIKARNSDWRLCQ
ncbi:extensin family protein [Paracoccus sulfuroxidans]|uniref:Extensin-like C-terminal domain-containing protein n=1 Tax=Paracoccus sulfuroxidans TaxID=384678 RepID=A0A562NCP6_9RHOB|nr:extensin family protein [Paracoccus sulfuroxidans]TWI29959.1 hypothetical protein IQ24_03432 [Paracoccus sulfuroxidans]